MRFTAGVKPQKQLSNKGRMSSLAVQPTFNSPVSKTIKQQVFRKLALTELWTHPPTSLIRVGPWVSAGMKHRTAGRIATRTTVCTAARGRDCGCWQQCQHRAWLGRPTQLQQGGADAHLQQLGSKSSMGAAKLLGVCDRNGSQ